MRVSLESRLRLPAGSISLAETLDLDRPVRSMRRGYFLALTILALLALGNYLIIDAMIRAQTHAVALTKIATSQRNSLRRAAQIVELVLRTQDQNPGGQRWLAATRRELASLADRIESDRQAFSQAVAQETGTLSHWLSKPLVDTASRQGFSDMTQEAARQLRSFAALDANQVEWRFSVWAPIQLMLAADGPLMTDVDAIADELYRHSVETSQRFQRLHVGLAIVTALTLLAEYLLIFHPMLRRLREGNRRITQGTEQLRHQASHDLLTGVGNRLLLRSTLEGLMQEPGPPRSFAVLLVDIHDFRKINELFGHAAGDHLLREMARRLQDCMRADDRLFRTGGDEFTVVMVPAPADEAAMLAALAHLGEEAGRPVRLQQAQELQLRATLGAAVRTPTSSSADLIKQADYALRMAKLMGPGSARIFDQSDAGLSAARELQAQQLGQALQRGQIKAFYQPIIDVQSRRVLGVEALARWVTDDGSVRSPADFLPTMQEFGMLDQLTDAILRAVVSDRARWREQNVQPEFVSVNFPEVTLADQRLLPRLLELTAGEGMGWLHVEVLETALLSRSTDTIERNILELSRLGVKVALDDFGTGYASLTHLRSLPCHSIKIDRSFVASMLKDAGTLLIVRGMIDIAQGLGIKVTVEGVETLAQHQVFTAYSALQAQGYLYSHPQSPQSLPQWLRAQAKPAECEAGVGGRSSGKSSSASSSTGSSTGSGTSTGRASSGSGSGSGSRSSGGPTEPSS